MSSQSTLGSEDLFGEAAAEMRDDVEEHLEKARAELPAADDVWETSADNVLGVLNGLKTALDAGDAEEHLRQAKKWYTLGERADAFEDAEDLAESIEEIEELVETLREANEQVGGLASSVPGLRSALESAHAEVEADAGDVDEEEADEDADDADEADEKAEEEGEDEEDEA